MSRFTHTRAMARTLTRGQRAAIRAAVARRGDLDLTQQQLADAAGVNVRTVNSFEGGHSWPTARTLGQIERLGLQWPVGYLAELAEEEDDKSDGDSIDEDVQHVLSIRRLSHGRKIQIIAEITGQASASAEADLDAMLDAQRRRSRSDNGDATGGEAAG